MKIVGCIALGAAAMVLLMVEPGSAQETPYSPRSSSPMGFRVEGALVAPGSGAGALSVPAHAGSAPNAAPAAQYGSGPAAARSGNVRIQGNSNLNATGQNVDTRALGAQNKGCTRVGGIGECQ